MNRGKPFYLGFWIAVILIITTDVTYALPTGNSFQKFSPNSSGIDFLNTESSYPTKAGQVVVGTIFDYALHIMPVVLEEGTTAQDSQDTLLSSHSYLSFGFTPDLELHMKFPFILRAQSSVHPSDKGMIVGTGTSYVAGGAKYRFFKQNIYEMAVGGELGTDLMRSNPYVGAKDVPFGTSVYVAQTADYDPLILGINLGYRFRSVGDPIQNEQGLVPPIMPVAHSFLFSTALSVTSNDFGTFIAEVYGTHAFINDHENFTDRSPTGMEWLLGWSKFFKNGVGVKVGGGSYLFRGIGTSKFRIVCGLDYAMAVKRSAIMSPFKSDPKPESPQTPPPDPFEEENAQQFEDEQTYRIQGDHDDSYEDKDSSQNYPGAGESEDLFESLNWSDEDDAIDE